MSCDCPCDLMAWCIAYCFASSFFHCYWASAILHFCITCYLLPVTWRTWIASRSLPMFLTSKMFWESESQPQGSLNTALIWRRSSSGTSLRSAFTWTLKVHSYWLVLMITKLLQAFEMGEWKSHHTDVRESRIRGQFDILWVSPETSIVPYHPSSKPNTEGDLCVYFHPLTPILW